VRIFLSYVEVPHLTVGSNCGADVNWFTSVDAILRSIANSRTTKELLSAMRSAPGI